MIVTENVAETVQPDTSPKKYLNILREAQPGLPQKFKTNIFATIVNDRITDSIEMEIFVFVL